MDKMYSYMITVIFSLILGAFITEYIIKNYYREKNTYKKVEDIIIWVEDF